MWAWRERTEQALTRPTAGSNLPGAVIGHRVGFGLGIALAFARHHMQKLRAGLVVQTLQRVNQVIQIVTIYRACVFKAQVFKHRLGLNKALRLLLNHLRQGIQRRRIFEHLLANFLGVGIKPAAHQFMQILVQSAHGWADRHVVVIQNDQQIAIAVRQHCSRPRRPCLR
jgi:hypothetical protein